MGTGLVACVNSYLLQLQSHNASMRYPDPVLVHFAIAQGCRCIRVTYMQQIAYYTVVRLYIPDIGAIWGDLWFLWECASSTCPGTSLHAISFTRVSTVSDKRWGEKAWAWG